MRIPLADLAAQYESIHEEIDAAVRDVLRSGGYILGNRVARLEEQVAAYCGASYGVAVNSGTDALFLALLALGIGDGDEVITSPFTFVATVEAIVVAGGRPVFADIDPRTFNLDPASVAGLVTSRTRAIIPVDLFGQMAPRDAFADVVGDRDIAVVWDCAQAIGSRYRDKPIGAFGDAATLSFFPTKNLGACGDGGMVLTNSARTRDALVKLRFHGSGGGYYYTVAGFCSRLDALQASILAVKLKHLPEWTAARRRNADLYRQVLEGASAQLPFVDPDCFHTYHQFTLRHRRRDELKEHLAERGVDSGIYYPLALHLQQAYAYLGYKPGDFPEAERATAEVLSIPIHPGLTGAQIRAAAMAVRDFDTV